MELRVDTGVRRWVGGKRLFLRKASAEMREGPWEVCGNSGALTFFSLPATRGRPAPTLPSRIVPYFARASGDSGDSLISAGDDRVRPGTAQALLSPWHTVNAQ